MKPEKILYAMNDIDGQFIQEAADHTETPRRRSHRFAALIAAVIALMAMTATAFAAEEIAGWFKEYFAKKSEIPLTPDQVQFIEENEQVIAQNQTNDAYSLELKSVLSDSNSILVTLRITAPTDLPSTNAQPSPLRESIFTIRTANRLRQWAFSSLMTWTA